MATPIQIGYDPGLQPERTLLSWKRTAAGLLLNSILNFRFLYIHQSSLIFNLAGSLFISAALTFFWGLQRKKKLIDEGVFTAIHSYQAVLLICTILVAAMGGLLASFHGLAYFAMFQ